ncbi:MAG: NDP-hexose 2,3-dehydratase family protein [Candidatus Brocadiales bacterium]|nr:NDP-hexose 2,3-dehydratase family protein [Candidatus Brocadiales bacterium]
MSEVSKHVEQKVSLFYQRLKDVLYYTGEDKNIDFYVSSLTEYNPFYSTEEIKQWLSSINQEQYFDVTQIPLIEIDRWSFDKETGDLKHDSGGFFSIRGLKVKTNWGNVPTWSQPVIHQPEIGILGIITRKINGILYFLLQAKAEPGNINTYQLSPSVQATRSNYLQLHGGKPTLYLEYFIDHPEVEVLLDQLQSEQGARFYHKRNRNIIIRIPDDHELEIGQNHRWLTLGQIVKLAQINNTVNMDTRSVISSISYEPENVTSRSPINENLLTECISDFSLASDSNSGFGEKLMVSSHPNSPAIHSFDRILKKIAKRKFECLLDVELIPLNMVEKWICTADEIFHPHRMFFSVIGVHVEAMNREVTSWDQPIVKQDNPGIVGFIAKEIDGVLHFLTQLKLESGVMDLLEISPTVQCITGNYSESMLPEFVDEMVNQKNSTTITNVFQSEEGGRFFQESNQNLILLAGKSFQPDEGKDFIWMTIGQLKQFIKFNNFLNVEARSLLACLPTS